MAARHLRMMNQNNGKNLQNNNATEAEPKSEPESLHPSQQNPGEQKGQPQSREPSQQDQNEQKGQGSPSSQDGQSRH